MIKTYLDSGVLIAAARGTNVVSSRAILILDDDQRQFCSSCFVRLEILAKAKYHLPNNFLAKSKIRMVVNRVLLTV